MIDIGTLLASFRRDLRARNRSPRTIDIYTEGVTLFAQHLGTEPGDTPLGQFTRGNVKEWVYAASDKWAASTVQTRFSGLSRFGKWLVAEEILATNPTDNVSIPTAKTKSPHIISDDQLRELLKACDGRDFMNRRDTAIIRVLLDTGVRAAELTGMRVSTTNLDDQRTTVNGKGSKIRAVYFSPRTVSALDKYIRARMSHRYAKRDELWLTQRGAMSPDTLRDRVAHLGNQVDIPDLHPHRFRHTWAHDHMLNETSTMDLKQLAGWTSDKMLSRYGASGADVRAAAAARRASRGDRV